MQQLSFVQRTKNFWGWFSANEERLSEIASYREPAADSDKEDRREDNIAFINTGVGMIGDINFNIGGEHEFTFAVNGATLLFYLLPYVCANLPEQYREKWSFSPGMPGSGGAKFDFGMHGVRLSTDELMISATPGGGGQSADLRFFAEALVGLDTDKRWGIFFTLMDITIGEMLSNLCVGKIEPAETLEEGMFPLTELEKWLTDNICKDTTPSALIDRHCTCEVPQPPSKEPTTRSNELRDDIVVGFTSCFQLINEYHADLEKPPEVMPAHKVFAAFGAKAVFLHYYNSENNLDERNALMDKIEEAVLGERGSGNELGLVIGGSVGAANMYIELLLFDETAFIERVKPILGDFPHMVFCKEFHKDGKEFPLSDDCVMDFFYRLEKLGKSDEDYVDMEIVLITGRIPEEERDYKTCSLFASCLNNCGVPEDALKVLEKIRDEGVNDPKWHYKRAYSLNCIEGREKEADVSIKKAIELAEKAGEVSPWFEELSDEISESLQIGKSPENVGITVTSTSEETLAALAEEAKKAMTLVGAADSDTSTEIVTKIRVFVDDLLTKGCSGDEVSERAISLGALWGEAVIKEYGWEYKDIDFGDGETQFYLVSPEEYFCCNPLYFINKILSGNNRGLDGNNDNTVLLLFNMMKDIDAQRPDMKYRVIS
jgi:hypothetical protein